MRENFFILKNKLNYEQGVLKNLENSFETSVEFVILTFEKATKKIILSTISRLIDPLGLVGPFPIQTKFRKILWRKVALFFAQAQVAPLKTQTLSRLELLGAVTQVD
nr:unnamed protein product [Callosobruchus chinensis]